MADSMYGQLLARRRARLPSTLSTPRRLECAPVPLQSVNVPPTSTVEGTKALANRCRRSHQDP